MAHLKSVWLWDKVALLSYLQFPWRFLTIGTFSFSVAAGSIVLLFPKKVSFKLITISSFVVIIFLFYSSFFQPKTWSEIADEEKFSGELWQKQQTISIFDYLPIYAELPPPERAPEEPLILEGEGQIISGEKGTNWQNWKIFVESDKAQIQLPLFDFPGWKVWVDSNEVATNHENDLGLITFTLASGQNEIRAKLTDTPIRQAGNFATIAGLFAIPLFLRKGKD